MERQAWGAMRQGDWMHHQQPTQQAVQEPENTRKQSVQEQQTLVKIKNQNQYALFRDMDYILTIQFTITWLYHKKLCS